MFAYQKVRVIGITNPLDMSMDAEDLLSYCARVSNPSNQDNHATSSKLLGYLMDHKHWSPFEMVNVVIEIETTRDIGRQILRHRSFSFQEFSQRYARNATGFPTHEYRECRLQDTKNRQSSLSNEDKDLAFQWREAQKAVEKLALEKYEWALSQGIAKEQARVVLPEGLTMSRMYMQGSLRSWLHYCEVRRDPSTQKEHRDIAEKVYALLMGEFPFLKAQEEVKETTTHA